MREVCATARALLRSPGYTLVAVLTLALTIGANSAMYSAVRAVLLRPLDIDSPQDLVVCWGSDPARDLPVVELSYLTFDTWASHSRSFSQVAAMGSSTWPAILEQPGPPSRISTSGVSASFFDTLGVAPALGRPFSRSDDLPNAARVVLLSHRLWVGRFGADPAVLGKTIRVADAPRTIVGIMPAGFDFPQGTDLWMPVVPVLGQSTTGWNPDMLRNVGVLYVIGRLRPDVSATMAADELNRLAADMARREGTPRFGTDVVARPLQDYVFGPSRRVLWVLWAAVGVLLAVGCANIAGLMLTQVSLRAREHAIRRALGASSLNAVRTWFLEALLLSTLGGALGLATAWAMLRVILAVAPEDVSHLGNASIDSPVALVTVAAMLVTTVLCGAVPAREAIREGVTELLKNGARATPSGRSIRLRSVLVTLQVAVAVVLLTAAGLVSRSFLHLQAIDLGFDPADTVTMNVSPSALPVAPNEWFRTLLARLQRLPEVEAAGAVYVRPLRLGPIGQEASVILEGQDPTSAAATRDNPTLNYQVATPDYFRTLRIALIRGRVFDARDTDTAPAVAIVSTRTAERLWPRQNPIGKRISLPSFAPDGQGRTWRSIVGLVGTVRYRGLEDPRLDVYVPATPSALTASDLVVRGRVDVTSLARAVQEEVRRVDPGAVVDGTTSLDAVVARAMAPWRFGASLFTMFAVLALVLATVGVVGLVALEVAQRNSEFAVRLAVGAQKKHILGHVLGRTGRRVATGLTLGTLVAMAATRSVQALLVGVDALDVTTFGTAIALVACVAALGAYVPARRAARTDPMTLLHRQ